ncbi:MAG: hypothetical protein ABSH48_01935 [Verrucomicrobiota bacterium]|jgi:hypothetical protein
MRSVISVTLALAMFALVGAWYCWDADRNHGFQFGYYGDLNRVSNALTNIPGVTITQTWQKGGLSLQAFGFGLWYSNLPVRLDFGETDPVRTMGPLEVRITCGQRIRAEVAAARAHLAPPASDSSPTTIGETGGVSPVNPRVSP